MLKLTESPKEKSLSPHQWKYKAKQSRDKKTLCLKKKSQIANPMLLQPSRTISLSYQADKSAN